MKACLFYLLLLTSPWILAQEDDSANADTEEVTGQEETALEENNDNEEPAEDEDDVDFVPSIQVSEDFSVSFPVDI